jgi:protein phosphatase
MKEQVSELKIQAAAISDRGLSEKRPLNEDSFLSDTQRHLFAVADGVGGADAGEVASQTAMEVLDEAFRHQVEGADIEDLMELAIQRANASIHQMAREHPKFSMMATTIVALHLDGRIATIGHVGDSRLYRLTPAGQLRRETEDHSVVEEEVRAGRMTAAQAANHPSRNVISRALGAEDAVEVDMKTIEVEDGTAFLLCSDGITRHLPDDELRTLLTGNQNMEAVCAEMKRRCYERGAEDNLTAVIVRVGEAPPGANAEFDEEKTLAGTLPLMNDTISMEPIPASQFSNEQAPANSVANQNATVENSVPVPPVQARAVDRLLDNEAGPVAVPLQTNTVQSDSNVNSTTKQSASKNSSGIGGILKTIGFLILLVVVAAGAFYGGMTLQRMRQEAIFSTRLAQPTPQPTPPSPVVVFDQKRQAVDNDPARLAAEMASQQNNSPLSSSDPQFLYLYGRARLLSGEYEEAVKAFQQAVSIADGSATPESAALKVEARLGLAAAALKLDRTAPRIGAFNTFDSVVKKGSAPNTSGINSATPNQTQSNTQALPSASQPAPLQQQ